MWSGPIPGVRPLYDDGAGSGAGGDARLRADAGRARRRRRRCCRCSAARSPPTAGSPRRRWRSWRRICRRRRRAPADWTAAGRCPAATSRRRVRRRSGAPLRARYAVPAARRWPRRLVRAYGTRARRDRWATPRTMADLGRDFGAGLTEAEVAYLRRKEWARAPPTCCGAAQARACGSSAGADRGARRGDGRRRTCRPGGGMSLVLEGVGMGLPGADACWITCR